VKQKQRIVKKRRLPRGVKEIHINYVKSLVRR